MTLNLLFDLDDTLLDTNLDAFLAGYFKKLAGYMAKFCPPEVFTRILLQSTQIMYESSSMDQTLEQVFNQNFYPALGLNRADMQVALDDFYDNVFPTLGSLTSPRPEAVSLIETAFSKGWKISIATDPLFPRKAILHRLRWAGLDPDKYAFTFISDFHQFHFAKKKVSFYPEFLNYIEWTDEPVLMIGDSIERDVNPSQSAGVPVFWLNADAHRHMESVPSGSFADLENYLIQTDPEQLLVNYKTPQALLAFLQATPAALHTLLVSSSAENLQKRPSDNEWSVLEILCHLRDIEKEINLARVKVILRDENAFIPGQVTDQWADERNYAEQNPFEAFNELVANRTKLISILRAISLDDWNRPARHTFLGPTFLVELVEFMVDHDRAHIKQIQNLLR